MNIFGVLRELGVVTFLTTFALYVSAEVPAVIESAVDADMPLWVDKALEALTKLVPVIVGVLFLLRLRLELKIEKAKKKAKDT